MKFPLDIIPSTSDSRRRPRGRQQKSRRQAYPKLSNFLVLSTVGLCLLSFFNFRVISSFQVGNVLLARRQCYRYEKRDLKFSSNRLCWLSNHDGQFSYAGASATRVWYRDKAQLVEVISEEPAVIETLHPSSSTISRHTEKRVNTETTKDDERSGGIDALPKKDDNSKENTTTDVKRKSKQFYDLEQLKQQVDIVSVIESFNLDGFKRTSSGRAMAVCPFHQDHNPSLHIDGSNLRMYKCFACGAGGDVFKFVQEYSNLPSSEMPAMSFGQAIQFVGTNFVDGNASPIVAGPSRLDTNLSEEEREKQQYDKDRILLANVVAAAFYANCLRQPFAGGARHYVRQRGLTAESIVTHALGFAPDCYFGATKTLWGEGSLVNHLRDLGFTPFEIVNAGLAVRTKSSNKSMNVHNDATSSSVDTTKSTLQQTSNDETEDAVDYNSLMDRFRARLIVPIFDKTGKNVVGFGGRTIPGPAEDNQIDLNQMTSESSVQSQGQKPGFNAPKYLNSPESVVFEKKRILFGQHLAETSFRDENQSQRKAGPTCLSDTSIIVVEGYMDVVALRAAGIRNVVSTMGTAVTPEQLSAAANIATRVGGHVVLCLDNDDAGVGAIERVCNNGMLLDTIRQFPGVELYVASLPVNIKDPAEFVEVGTCGTIDPELVSKTAIAFKKEVIDQSHDWIDWYTKRICASYNPTATSGTLGSMGDVFERSASFIATTCTNAADRTKRASSAAEELSNVLAKAGTGTDKAAGAVLTQLQSDLVDRVSKIARINEAVLRRAESVSTSKQETKMIISDLSLGRGPNSRDDLDDDKRTTRAAGIIPALIDNNSVTYDTLSKLKGNKPKVVRKRLHRQKEPPLQSLTPHFSGFRFEHKTDWQWLGLDDDSGKWKKGGSTNLVLGYKPMSAIERFNAKERGVDHASPEAAGLTDQLVYFNSVEYNGRQFLTEDAFRAGYNHRANNMKPTSSILETGIAPLLEQDVAHIVLETENQLLRALIGNKAARMTAKNVLDARNLLNFGDISDAEVKWSSHAKQWLFECLLGMNSSITQDRLPSDAEELRRALISLPDVPPRCFASQIVAANVTIPTFKSDDDKYLGWNRSDERIVNDTVTDFSVDLKTVNTKAYGLLDHLFEDDSNADPSLSSISAKDVRCDLLVQELCATLLWASAALQAKLIHQELESLARTAPGAVIPGGTQSVSQDSAVASTRDQGANGNAVHRENVSSNEKGHTHVKALINDLQKSNLKVQASADSLKRTTTRLMDYSTSFGRLEGRISAKLQSELGAKIDAFLEEHDFSSNKAAALQFGFSLDANDSEPYEDTLEKMQEEWGDWFDDDYVWSPNDSKSVASIPLPSHFKPLVDENEDHEPIEDALNRIEREWGEWAS